MSSPRRCSIRGNRTLTSSPSRPMRALSSSAKCRTSSTSTASSRRPMSNSTKATVCTSCAIRRTNPGRAAIRTSRSTMSRRTIPSMSCPRWRFRSRKCSASIRTLSRKPNGPHIATLTAPRRTAATCRGCMHRPSHGASLQRCSSAQTVTGAQPNGIWRIRQTIMSASASATIRHTVRTISK